MVLIFIKRANSFTVNNQALIFTASLVAGELDGLVPDPKAFRARVDTGTYSKAFVVSSLK